MFCPNCGKEVKDSKFCSGCGTPILRETEKVVHENEKNAKEGTKSSSTTVKIGLFAVAAVGVGILCLMFRQEKSEKFLDMLKHGEYTEAAAYYQSDLAGNEKELKKVYETVTTEINALVDSYYADNMSYDDAKNGLNAYSNFYVTETNNALQDIEKLKKSKDVFVQAEENFAAEEYRNAYQLYSQVIEADSNFSVAQEKYEECYCIIRDQIEAASVNASQVGDFLLAASILENEMFFFKETDKENFRAKADEYREEYLTDEMLVFSDYLAAGNYDECFELLNTITTNIGICDVITDANNNLQAAFESYITEQVNLYLESRDLVSCMQWIRKGQENIPASEAFVNLEIMLQEYYPVSLYEMEPFAIGDFGLGTDDTKEDTMGSVRNNVIRGYMDADDNQYSIYHIDGKYNTLKGTIAVTKGSIGSKKIGYIKIYGDDLLLWEDTNISAMTEPYDINVNISGVRQLKIEMCGPGNMGWSGISVMLCDPILQK